MSLTLIYGVVSLHSVYPNKFRRAVTSQVVKIYDNHGTAPALQQREIKHQVDPLSVEKKSKKEEKEVMRERDGGIFAKVVFGGIW